MAWRSSTAYRSAACESAVPDVHRLAGKMADMTIILRDVGSPGAACAPTLVAPASHRARERGA